MSSHLKTFAVAVIAFALGGAGGYHLARTPEVVVARVNGEEIRESQLQSELRNRFAGEVLRDVVHQKLIQQEAAKEKIQVSPAEIDKRLQELKGQPHVQSLLKAGQLSEQDLRRNLGTLLPLDALTEKRIKEEDEKEFLLRHREELETLEVQDLIFADEAKAQKALAELQAPGADFNAVAKAQDTGLAQAPPMTEVHRAQLDPAWAELLFRLRPGEISPVLQNEAGYHIFKVGARHFEYKDLKKVVREQLVAEKRGELLEDLRLKAKIEVMPPYKLPANPEEAPPSPRGEASPKASATARPPVTAPSGVPTNLPLETD